MRPSVTHSDDARDASAPSTVVHGMMHSHHRISTAREIHAGMDEAGDRHHATNPSDLLTHLRLLHEIILDADTGTA